MLRIQDLTKSYGTQVLFEEASLQMTPGERLGLVGRNGYGKSTLLRLILGEEQPDEGTISTPRNYRVGHLAQHLHFTQPTILEEGILGLPPEEEWDHYKVETILFGLGFTKADMDRAPSEFSGGFQIRLNLAKVLVSNPNLLLLDEPTNYLDIVSIRWITQFLREWPNEMILISHDREFMDSVTTHTALIHRQQIRRVEGNTAKLYTQVEQEEETYEKTRQNEAKQRKKAEEFINRFRAQAGRAAMVQSRIKQLGKMPQKDELAIIQDLDFNFHHAPFEAKTLMEIRDLSFSYDPSVPLIPKVTLTIQAKDRVAVIGKNGKGKSTLLNLLAGELKPLTGGISNHPNTQIGYFGQTNIARLNPKRTVEDEVGSSNPRLGRTEVRSICGLMMFSGETAEKKVSNLSGGEKSRVLLGKILAQPSNLLFLDEPTNHLDMQSIEALMESIHQFPGAAVIVTHSEEILRRLATKLVIFHHGIVDVFPGTYDDFLEKIGWEEENDGGMSATGTVPGPTQEVPVSQAGINKKDIRKQRAEILTERNRLVNPLKEEMTQLENEIDRLEKEAIKANEELLHASQKQDTASFVTLSKKAKDTQKSIEDKFAKLETVSQKFQEQSRHYDKLLEDLGEE